MKGYVPTPRAVVDRMVETLFSGLPPTAQSTVLDPGCGTGVFIEGILRWCGRTGHELPKIRGVELDPKHIASAKRLERHKPVEIEHGDFLEPQERTYDYIIGNPPYVSIERLTPEEKRRYRLSFKTAKGRFDLYLLFFEQALRSLNPGGRLVFITPEKYIYVDTATPLREMLSDVSVESIELLPEDTFKDLVTYPTITTVINRRGLKRTILCSRDGKQVTVRLPPGGSSWMPVINGHGKKAAPFTLKDICVRISCGVATGADRVFIKKNEAIDIELRPFTHRTIAGRDLISGREVLPDSRSMLVPYDRRGRLLSLNLNKHLGRYLSSPENRNRLLRRTCVSRKPWYAFHETPPLTQMLQPKLLCKDVSPTPHFWIDDIGSIVPQHSVYYIVPKDASRIRELADYLNSAEARDWLESHCQRAAAGYLRLQSNVLKRLPIPERFVNTNVSRGEAS